MPRCTCATSSRRHRAHHPHGTVGKIGPRLPRGPAQYLQDHALEKWFGSTIKDVVRRLQTSGTALRAIRWGFRVAEAKRGDAAAMLPPEFKQSVATDRNTNERSATYIGIVHDVRNVSGMLLH